MTEDLADLEQRHTGRAHGRGGAMAQAMGTDPLDPGPPARGGGDEAHRSGQEGAVWRVDLQEHGAVPVSRTTPSAVVGKRLADVGRKRQSISPPAFAENGDLASTPVHIVEAERGHLAAAEPEAGQDGEDREVAPTDNTAAVTAS
jgi:hypothetical protein